jgi:hypothetical protein
MSKKAHDMAIYIINQLSLTSVSAVKMAEVIDSKLLQFGNEINIDKREMMEIETSKLNEYIEHRKKQAVYKIAEEIYKMKGYELTETNDRYVGRRITIKTWLAL